MPRTIQYQCDIPGCTAIRKDSNHWFVGVILDGNKYDATVAALAVHPFSEKLAIDQSNYKILCGEDHVHTFISMHLNELFPKKQEECTSESHGCFVLELADRPD